MGAPGTIAVPFHPLQLLAHPAVGHSHPPGRLALADHSILGSLQPL
jgi:hypothetical protein